MDTRTYAKLAPVSEPSNWCVMEWGDGIDNLKEMSHGDEGMIFQKVRMTLEEFEALPEHHGW